MRKFLLLGVAALSLVACKAGDNSASQQAPVPAEQVEIDADINQAIEEWFEVKFMEGVKRSPMFLAQMGIKERMSA